MIFLMEVTFSVRSFTELFLPIIRDFLTKFPKLRFRKHSQKKIVEEGQWASPLSPSMAPTDPRRLFWADICKISDLRKFLTAMTITERIRGFPRFPNTLNDSCMSPRESGHALTKRVTPIVISKKCEILGYQATEAKQETVKVGSRFGS